MMLAYNGKYGILDEKRVSEALVASCTYNNHKVIEEILWIMVQINKVKESAILKLVKMETATHAVTSSDMCLLPFLTIIVNLLSQKDQHSDIQFIEQILTSNLFQKALRLGLYHNDSNFVN